MANVLAMPKELHPEVQVLRERLKSARPSLKEISDATGLGWHWLRALAEGRIKSPGFEKVQRLREHLDHLDEEARAA